MHNLNGLMTHIGCKSWGEAREVLANSKEWKKLAWKPCVPLNWHGWDDGYDNLLN